MKSTLWLHALCGALLIFGTPSRAHGMVAEADSDQSIVFVAGPSIGVPSGITLTAGIIAPSITLKASGGYWGKNWNGVQIDVGLVFANDGIFSHGVSLLIGTFRTNPLVVDMQGNSVSAVRQERYVGLVYEADYGGFFLQGGLGIGRGDYPNPELLFQAGYLIALP